MKVTLCFNIARRMPEGFRNADKEPHGLAKKPGHQPQHWVTA